MNRFLIVKTSAIGDVIQTFPVIEYLRTHYPACQIDWVVEKSCFELVSSHPLVDRAFCVDTKVWRKELFRPSTWSAFKFFYQELKQIEYDALFDLQANTKSALITYLAKAKAKVGYGISSVAEKPNLLVTTHRYNIPMNINVRHRYLQLVQSYCEQGIDYHPLAVSLRLNLEEKLRLDKMCAGVDKHPKLMVCFGSKWINKRLEEKTLESFLQLIHEHISPYFFFIWGGEEEKQVAAQLQQSFSSSSQSIGQLSLPLWHALMQQVDGVIAMDSAALHLCAMTSTPSFSVFGPSSSEVYKPLGQHHFAYQGSCPYRRTFVSRCPVLRTCPTGACIRELSAQALFESFSKWFEESVKR